MRNRICASLVLALAAAMPAWAAEPPIKLGVLEDQSGDFALATIGKVHGIQLATDEINAKGGIAGRKCRRRRGSGRTLSGGGEVKRSVQLASRVRRSSSANMSRGAFISRISFSLSASAMRAP